MIVTGNIPEGLSKNLPSAHITISLTSSDLAGVLKVKDFLAGDFR
jgi:hypothetical protein